MHRQNKIMTAFSISIKLVEGKWVNLGVEKNSTYAMAGPRFLLCCVYRSWITDVVYTYSNKKHANKIICKFDPPMN